MGATKNKKGRGGLKFVMLPHYLVESPAYRDLTPNARSLYTELVLRYNGSNNGSIGMGNREAGERLSNDAGKDTGRRAFNELIEHGFIAISQDASFNQKRLSREWLLTDFRDDRNGQGARKDFMRWGREKQNIGAPMRQIGAPKRLCGNTIPQTDRDRRKGAPVKLEATKLQAHPRATYISSHRQRISEAMAEPARQSSDGLDASAQFPQSERIPPMVETSGRNEIRRDLTDPEQAFLRWLVGFDDTATHRKAQQNLSGRMNGPAIAQATAMLAQRGLLHIEAKGRSRIYALADRARAVSMLKDDGQTDIESWLGGTS